MVARSLDGRVAIVTGASDGLGKQFAHGLAEAGASVVIAARRGDLLERFAAELREQHGTPVLAVPTDVTSESDVRAVVTRTAESFGTIDVLVNNAGATRMLPLLEHTLEEWQQVIDVNLTGSFLMARETARVMIPQGSGSIVNVSSVFALGATRQFPVISYYAAKGGVEGLTKGLAVELGPHNVRVNSIAPGFFPSPMSSGMFSEDDAGAALRRDVLLPRTALPSLPRSEDLRGTVRYLAGTESAFVTGHTLVVDGGWRAF